jgi:mannose-6-phosphate isomerase-like protein (cupin superfamily)
VISGSGVWEIGGIKHDFAIGEEKLVPISAKHRIIAGKDGISILEISIGEFDEGDIVRYEDKYGRV